MILIHSNWLVVRLYCFLCVVNIAQTRPHNEPSEELDEHDIDLNSALEKSFSWVDLFTTAVESTPLPASPQTKVQERAGVVVGRELLGTGAQLH